MAMSEDSFRQLELAYQNNMRESANIFQPAKTVTRT
jgi:hypothetical protein